MDKKPEDFSSNTLGGERGTSFLPFAKQFTVFSHYALQKSSTTAKNMRSSAYFLNAISNPSSYCQKNTRQTKAYRVFWRMQRDSLRRPQKCGLRLRYADHAAPITPGRGDNSPDCHQFRPFESLFPIAR